MKYISIFTLIFSFNFLEANEKLAVEFFAAHSSYNNLIISPDGRHIAFTYEEDNNEVKLAIVTSDMKQITASFGFGANKHVIAPFWANNNRIVMRIVKSTGYLDGKKTRLYTVAANVDGGNRKRLFDDGLSFFRIINTLKSDPNHIIVAKYHRNDRGKFSLQKLNINNGKLKFFEGIPRVEINSRIVGVSLDLNEKLRFAFEINPGEDKYDPKDNKLTIHYKSVSGWKKVSLPIQRNNPTFNIIGFKKNNEKFYFLSNMDMPKNDTSGVFSFNLKTEQIKLEYRHKDVDVRWIIQGSKGEAIGLVTFPDYPSQYYFDENSDEVKFNKNLHQAFKAQSIVIRSYTSDGTKAIVTVFSDKNPGEYFLLDKKTSKMRYLASRFPKINSKSMSTVEAFSFKTRDGIKIFGYLTLPKDQPDTNLPLIVLPHGGPFGVSDSWGFDREAQLFASRGYAVIQVNFRGSGGYGEDFMRSGYRKWGREMQDDVTDATLWAIKEGIADKNRICLYGGSYGGYAAIQGLVREPNLYKCGVGVAGVYSLPMMWDGESDGRKSRARRYSNIWLNDFIGKDQAELKAYSPAFNVDKIKAAVFIIHGSNDVRVPISHAELLKTELDKIGKSYEWLVREEGHGFSQVKNRIDQYNQVLAFFDKHIGE